MIRINESESIKDFLIRNELNRSQQRLDDLKRIGAPGIVITSQEKMVNDLKNKKFDCGGDKSLLNLTFNSFTEKKGNGGKPYIEFDNGVKYFPNAKYGRYISK